MHGKRRAQPWPGEAKDAADAAVQSPERPRLRDRAGREAPLMVPAGVEAFQPPLRATGYPFDARDRNPEWGQIHGCCGYTSSAE